MKVHDVKVKHPDKVRNSGPAASFDRPDPSDLRLPGHEPTAPVQAAAAASSTPLRSPQAAVAFCDRFNAGEGLAPADLASKLSLMTQSALKLSRCMPALFMSDLLGPYAELGKLSDKPAPTIWIGGDAHLGNFGVIQDKSGNPVWGLNDFDMTCKGSPAMDLDRLAFSLVSFLRERGVDPSQSPQVVDALVQAYLAQMQETAGGKDPGMAYLHPKQTTGNVQKLLDKSKTSRADWIQKYAVQDKAGEWSFTYGKNVDPVDTDTAKKITESLHQYDSTQGATPSLARPLQILGVAQKMQSGGSSHGQARYFALVADADPTQPPHILEVKQELPAPLVGWKGDPAKAAATSAANWTGNLARADAAQVVQGQTAMGGCPNPATGATSIDGISYLVREREPCKGSLGSKDFATVDDFLSFAKQAGQALALAHGRDADTAKQIVDWAGDSKIFSQRLNAFAQTYADQAEADVAAFRTAHPEAVNGPPVPDTGD